MGAWPDLTEYHEAVQHPQKAFADPGLKAVTLELDRFGMPKPVTGGNAVVYKANEPGGAFAVYETCTTLLFLFANSPAPRPASLKSNDPPGRCAPSVAPTTASHATFEVR